MKTECRMVACPACGGDGGGEAMPTGPHDSGRWVECNHCGGTGSIDTEPAGFEHTDHSGLEQHSYSYSHHKAGMQCVWCGHFISDFS